MRSLGRRLAMDSAVNLYLHIGTEKTGTTSVQRFFRTNRELLARSGILYPVAPGNENHTGLAVAAQKLSRRGALRKLKGVQSVEEAREFRSTLMDELAGEFSIGHYRTVVMSGEHCSSRLLDDAEVQWLKNALSPFFENIYIVVYIRRQDDYLLSTYSTSVKSGATRELALPPERLIQCRYDHWDLLSRWARIFGREQIICRKFERSQLKSQDIVDDFLSITGIDPALGLVRPEHVNESLDADSLEFLRLFNGYVPRIAKNGLNPERDNIVPLLSRMSQGPLITLAEDELARFMALFRQSNRQVAEEYFGGARENSDDPLFEPRTDARSRTAHTTLTAERAVEICAGLWQEKQAQLERVMERAKRRAAGVGPRSNRRRMNPPATAEE
jgi:hypothetical protein